MIHLKEKDFVPQLKIKNCGQTRFFDTFSNKSKTSETALLLRFEVVGITGYSCFAPYLLNDRKQKLAVPVSHLFA